MRAVDVTTTHMTEDGLQDLGERIRECNLLTQVVHTIACSYALLADFWGKRKQSKLLVKYILLVDQIQLDGSEISHIVPHSQLFKTQTEPHHHHYYSCYRFSLLQGRNANGDRTTLSKLTEATSHQE